jgi:hypothetical protein
MKVEDDKEPINTERTKTGFVKEAEDDWVEDGFLDIPYEDEIIEPIDDYADYEAALVDNDVVYRLQNNYSRVTGSELATLKETERDNEVIEAIPLKKEKEESFKEEIVNAAPVEVANYDDESKILPVEKQTISPGNGFQIHFN